MLCTRSADKLLLSHGKVLSPPGETGGERRHRKNSKESFRTIAVPPDPRKPGKKELQTLTKFFLFPDLRLYGACSHSLFVCFFAFTECNCTPVVLSPPECLQSWGIRFLMCAGLGQNHHILGHVLDGGGGTGSMTIEN